MKSTNPGMTTPYAFAAAMLIVASATAVARAAYVDEVLADAPLLYYQFSETSGTAINDSSGNAFHGTYNGDEAQLNVAGAPGTGSAVNFTNNAPLNYVAVPGLGGTSTAFTMEFIFNNNEFVSLDSIYTTNAFPTGAVHVAFVTGNRINFTLNNVATNDDLSFNNAASTFLTNTTYHVAITADLLSNIVTMYVNGVATQTRSFNANPDTVARLDLAARIGTWSNQTTRAMNGVLDEFAIYSGLLSPTRIADHAAAAFAIGDDDDDDDGGAAVPAPAALPAGLALLALVATRRRRR